MPNPFRPLKHLVFQKGGIGRSMSREETVRRLNPVMRAQLELNHYYNYVINAIGEPPVAAELEQLQKTARADAGKIAETIFSAGGVAINGTDMEPEDYRLSDDAADMLFELMEQEDAFKDLVQEEFELEPFEHQLRTKAVLTNLLTNSEARMGFLKTATKRRRPASQD